jgi:hypothetical protein
MLLGLRAAMRSTFLLVALLGLSCVLAGIWFGGFRNEAAIAKILSAAHQPNQTPFFRSPDSFYWVSYAREMLDTGRLRIRFTHMDNAPYGRPNLGWASLNAWYLVALGKIWSLAIDTPVRDALLSASMWAAYRFVLRPENSAGLPFSRASANSTFLAAAPPDGPWRHGSRRAFGFTAYYK